MQRQIRVTIETDDTGEFCLRECPSVTDRHHIGATCHHFQTELDRHWFVNPPGYYIRLPECKAAEILPTVTLHVEPDAPRIDTY
jgi:hypothetical protein